MKNKRYVIVWILAIISILFAFGINAILNRMGPTLDTKFPELNIYREIAFDDGSNEWVEKARNTVSMIEIKSEQHALLAYSIMKAVNKREPSYDKNEMEDVMRKGIVAQADIIDRTIKYSPGSILEKIGAEKDDPLLLPLVKTSLGGVRDHRAKYLSQFDAKDWSGMVKYKSDIKAHVDAGVTPQDKMNAIIFVTTSYPPELLLKYFGGR